MTRAEDRLTEYLNAVADSVRADSTRPVAPQAAPAPPGRARAVRRRAVGQRRWPGRAVPLAAAAVVVVIAALGALLAAHIGGHRTAPAGAQPTQPTAAVPQPRYYMELEGAVPSPVIRSVATGAVLDRLRDPRGEQEAAMTAAPDGRTFYVAYGPLKGSTHPQQLTIYSVTVPSAGKVSTPVPVKGGVVTYTNIAAMALAVSPDGGRLAVTLTFSALSGPGVTDEVLVIDLRTGTRQVWQGGLDRAGYTVALGSVAWAGNGQSLEFLVTSCPVNAMCPGGLTPQVAPGSSQVRSLPLNTSGGSLAASTVLLRAPYSAAAMTADRAGNIDLMRLSDSRSGVFQSLAIDQFSAGGALERVLYRRAYPKSSPMSIGLASLSADPSGSHLILGLIVIDGFTGVMTQTDTTTVGWVADGTLHPLPSNAKYITPLAAW
jgi:hypothetical protein